MRNPRQMMHNKSTQRLIVPIQLMVIRPLSDDDDLFSPPPHSFTSLPLNHIITTIDHHDLDNHLDLDLDLV